MIKTKAFTKDSVHDLDSHVQKWPALVTDVGAFAAGTDFIVRIHINIEDKFALNGREGDSLGMILRGTRKNGTDLNTHGDLLGESLPHVLRGREAQVTYEYAGVSVHLNVTREFASFEDADVVVRKPPVHEVEREELAVIYSKVRLCDLSTYLLLLGLLGLLLFLFYFHLVDYVLYLMSMPVSVSVC